MALSCGRRKQRRGKGGGGCRHFHVHYHLPRPVCAFSFVRLLPRFSLLSCVLIPPVLFFAVIAFLVSFVWFTLLYFVASLFKKDRNCECSKNDSVDHASDVYKYRREDDGQQGKVEAKAVTRVAELTGDSAAAKVCAKRFEIKEVHVDGFSDECQNISRMASSDACVVYEVHTDHSKPSEEVIIFETNREELNAIAGLDCFSQRRKVQDVPIDWFVEEPTIRVDSTSGDSFPIVLSCNSVEVYDFPEKNKVVWLSMAFLDENKKNMIIASNTSSDDIVDQVGEELACTSSETCDFIDKHEARKVELDGCANDSKFILLASSDGLVHDGIQDEHKKENTQEKDAKSVQELLANCVACLEVFDEQQEIQKVVVDDDNKLPEVSFIEANRTLVVGTSNEVHDYENETSGLSFDSVCEDKNVTVASSNASFRHYIGDEDGKHKELIEKYRDEASGIASVVCGFADNHQTTRGALDGFANEDNTGEVASPDSSVLERIEDEDMKTSDICTNKGASHRLPLVRRSPVPWWNLCGVLDVFAGCKD